MSQGRNRRRRAPKRPVQASGPRRPGRWLPSGRAWGLVLPLAAAWAFGQAPPAADPPTTRPVEAAPPAAPVPPAPPATRPTVVDFAPPPPAVAPAPPITSTPAPAGAPTPAPATAPPPAAAGTPAAATLAPAGPATAPDVPVARLPEAGAVGTGGPTTGPTGRLPAAAAPGSPGVVLPEVIVHGRAESLVGVADTASQGYVGPEVLDTRPLLRPGEVLETVPGVVITQHSGAGKANQFFVRGFNLDHGTDLYTTVAGLPINLPSHAHGQGYTDLNFLIPELISDLQYRKGPYFADEGDFASAGAVHIGYVDQLDKGLAVLEAGSYGFARAVFADSAPLGNGRLLYGFEGFYDDGPWDTPDRYRKVSGVLKYSEGDKDNGWSLTALGYHGDWSATDQVARRAIDSGLIDRFGSLDTSSGGNSQRYALIAEGHQRDTEGATKLLGYAQYYDLDLFSNFTYFLDDPVNGDQFEQQDRRFMGGLDLSHTWFGTLFDRSSDTTAGVQGRNDTINNGLWHTAERQRLDVTRRDRTIETSLGVYLQNETRWTDWFRSTIGARGDFYHFDVDNLAGANGGNDDAVLFSPKVNLVFGPWAKTEFYLSGGYGFHSNDARGVVATTAPGGTGDIVQPADPLVRTKGAEFGVRTEILPGLRSTVSAWVLYSDSELIFVGDAGTTEPSRPSRREGLEFANFYQPTDWLTIDADYSLSRARFTESDPAGDHIPGSIENVVSAGITVHDPNPDHGGFAGLRVRYFGPRPLIEDDSVRSSDSTLLNAEFGYRFNPNLRLTVEILNLLDSDASDIEYYYPSRLANEPAGPDDGGYNDIHLHPAIPLSVRVGLTYRF